MSIHFDVPSVVEESLKGQGRDPNQAMKEAALVEIYRQGVLSHGQLAESLGLSRPEADALLKRHNVTEDLPTAEELREQVVRLRGLVG